MNPISMAVDGMAYRAPAPPPPPPQRPTSPLPVAPAGRGGMPAGPAPAGPDPYALPPGTAVGDAASGTQAQPFDVTLSRLATAVYNEPGHVTRPGPPQPWHAVDNAELAAHGIDDPQAWRQTYLGGSQETEAQHFKAEIYTDGQGNYVLAYRGTDGSGADWMNNFKQGTGFETQQGDDKFSGMAARTATEFKKYFADDNGNNLAITGHSQGGGLASVGAIVSGIPAVTFDASGIHPNTWDRLGIDPQAARDKAENGNVRAYSLHDDLLTQTQEGGPIGLLAPDAIGTKIVVAPSGREDATTIARGLENEVGMPASVAEPLGAGLEVAHRIPVPLLAGEGALAGSVLGPLGTVGGALLGGGIGVVGDLARGAVSHSPELLTEAMIQQQPWQEGYENPTDVGKQLQDLVPDALKDDYARNVHETAEGIVDVVNHDFADGDYVQGGFRIAGDVGNGAIDSLGDTVHRGAESLADAVDKHVDGPVGDVLSTVVDGAGTLTGRALDVVGDGVEALLDTGGKLAQTFVDRAGQTVQTMKSATSHAVHATGAVVSRGVHAVVGFFTGH